MIKQIKERGKMIRKFSNNNSFNQITLSLNNAIIENNSFIRVKIIIGYIYLQI